MSDFYEELEKFKFWLRNLTPTGLKEAERDILEEFERIKQKEVYY